MKISLIGGYLSGTGGVETVIKILSKYLVNNGHSVELFILGDKPLVEWESGILTNYMGIYKRNKRMQFLRNYFYYKESLKKYFEKSLAKAFVFFDPIFIFPARAAMNKLNSDNRPLIAWPHSSLTRNRTNKNINLKNILLIKSLKKADAYFAICNGVYNQILNITGESKNIYIIYNPVEISTTKIIARETEKFKLLYIGRLEDKVKRIAWILRALNASKSKNWILDIFGDGPDKNKLVKLSKELGISGKVNWHGFCKNPWEKISSASILINTSRFEGFGMTIIEAMKYGIPVLSSNCPVGPSEIVINNVNGWLFNYQNFDGFSYILNEILVGRIKLPNRKVIIESVKKFDSFYACDKFLKTIELLINKS